MRTFPIFMVSSVLGLASISCSKQDDGSGGVPKPQTSVTPAAAPPPEPVPAPPPSASAAAQANAKATVELQIASVGDTMFYDKKTLTAPTGATVHLTLKNNGKLPVMTHNWVLVKRGTEAAVAAAGLEKAPDAGYVVPSDDILAYTPLAPPGQTAEVTFTAPAPGDYPYICTFPGHYVLMKGVFTVTP